ncbi:hypothetical protein BGZ51_007611 [Haplosporangium sp. Z 767]|nr:hypothetical protein BGZ51_007611 [Haplosporangium sp. Z 767]
MSHESVSNNNSSPSPIESAHPLYMSASSQQHSPSPLPYHQHHSHTPYQAPSPPYSHSHIAHSDHRSNSIELAQKPILPYLRPQQHHPYASPPHRTHPYSPSTLPPLIGNAPLSPQSPIDSGLHYPTQSSSREERRHYRTESPMSSSSPPPLSPSSTSTPSSSGTTALSANDRRERNKAASAKYRAKKHSQSGEMRQQITVLHDQNNVLTRQLEESRAENASLKSLVEKLKGRLVAEKVLKRLREVGREKKQKNKKRRRRDVSESESEEDVDVDVDVEDDEIVEEDMELQKRQKDLKPKVRRRIVHLEENSDDEHDEDYH